MSVVQICENCFIRASLLIRKRLVTYGERKNIKRKRKLIETVQLSETQKRQIDEFFLQNYGKKVPYDWHRLYQSYTGAFHFDYFPELLFSSKLEPMTNPYRTAELLGDKNILLQLFDDTDLRDLHLPQTHVSCVNGIMLNSEKQLITKSEAARILCKGQYVIKKTIDTSSGRDVAIIKDATIDETECILNQFGDNFIVQELIEQSKELSALNKSSVNTFRVISYICNSQVYVCPVALRMGRENADRDNIHYGGISIGVNCDGTLKKYAFSEYGEKFVEHPDSKIHFEGYCIPEAGDMIRRAAKKLHGRVPWLGIISWDLTIDKESKIVLIEMNTTGQSAWFCQMVNGEPLFGENTADILNMIRKR